MLTARIYHLLTMWGYVWQVLFVIICCIMPEGCQCLYPDAKELIILISIYASPLNQMCSSGQIA